MHGFPGSRSARAVAGLSFATALALAACSSGGASDTSAADRPLSVVASTNVWGSVAQAVAGDNIVVTSIVNEPFADPHSFEATPSDVARLTDASLIVYNGGGYDQFVDDVLASDDSNKLTVNAFDLHQNGSHEDNADSHDDHSTDSHEDDADSHDDHSTDSHEDDADSHDGHDHGHGGVNEHVWFDIDTVDATAKSIADKLGELDPDNAGTYQANADDFHNQLEQVSGVTTAIAVAHPDAPVAQTEPVATYLLDSADLVDLTPPDFSSAIENGNDPAPAAIAAIRQLLTDREVDALIFNVQTQDNVTQDVRATAESAGVPVVEVTETLPEGLDYIQWLTKTADDLSAALQPN
ncbi:metal ABC transporter solute-binding protein, Zn/Mn family [Rhodococcus sp. WMMA185]|uniref:metal ABC transporter solute-binding protein, Zn/Mn family n=1 Tax=Rhodococcus sp. WMMA185 TaxID=679318 RepID=UPI00087846BC|nr:zinc ABC transporter substrate-binding protein [Rhodococcus sp. WMMA185]